MLTFYDIYKNQRKKILFSLDKTTMNNVFSTTIVLKQALPESGSYNFLKQNKFSFIDATVVDNLERKNRFLLTYNFFNYYTKTRIYLNSNLNLYSKTPTMSNIFHGAETAEREIYDMYGVFFQDHKDLRRLLTDYSFIGNPLKKDFPLSGFVETKYSYIKKTLVFKHVELAQEFRGFEFKNPWI